MISGNPYQNLWDPEWLCNDLKWPHWDVSHFRVVLRTVLEFGVVGKHARLPLFGNRVFLMLVLTSHLELNGALTRFFRINFNCIHSLKTYNMSKTMLVGRVYISCGFTQYVPKVCSLECHCLRMVICVHEEKASTNKENSENLSLSCLSFVSFLVELLSPSNVPTGHLWGGGSTQHFFGDHRLERMGARHWEGAMCTCVSWKNGRVSIMDDVL